jgi:uncharacterized membrane protein
VSLADSDSGATERLALLGAISLALALFPCAVVWLVTRSSKHALEALVGFAFMFALIVSLSYVANKFFPSAIARRVQHSRPRNFLELLILAAVVIPVAFGWSYPVIGRHFLLLFVAAVLFLAVMFVPVPKRRERDAHSFGSPHPYR